MPRGTKSGKCPTCGRPYPTKLKPPTGGKGGGKGQGKGGPGGKGGKGGKGNAGVGGIGGGR